jgi:hypothetical protein
MGCGGSGRENKISSVKKSASMVRGQKAIDVDHRGATVSANRIHPSITSITSIASIVSIRKDVALMHQVSYHARRIQATG